MIRNRNSLSICRQIPTRILAEFASKRRFCCWNVVRRARLSHHLSIRLHGTNDVEFSAKHHRFANLKEIKTTSIRNGNELKKKVERGRNRLYAFQHEDGGWGWWKNDESDPFMTAYVIDGLTLAKQAGYEIDDERLARAREKLARHARCAETRETQTRAFMVYALTESGGVDSKHVEKLFAERNNLSHTVARFSP